MITRDTQAILRSAQFYQSLPSIASQYNPPFSLLTLRSAWRMWWSADRSAAFGLEAGGFLVYDAHRVFATEMAERVFGLPELRVGGAPARPVGLHSLKFYLIVLGSPRGGYFYLATTVSGSLWVRICTASSTISSRTWRAGLISLMSPETWPARPPT